MFGRIRKLHLIGIGGEGISGIAEVLLNMGYEVSGSDLRTTDITRRLDGRGGRIALGHDPANLEDAQVVVVSSAIPADNPEVTEARRRGIPVIPRAEMLAELMRMKYGIAVGGAHGKTTTTWLISLVLAEGGLDPTIVVGGKLKGLNANAKLGGGDYLVAEADESDGSFLKLSPTIAVVTTVDEEHLDHYSGLAEIQDAFATFLNSVPFYGTGIMCLDEENIQSLMPRMEKRVLTYGFSAQADFTASDVRGDGLVTHLMVSNQGRVLGPIEIQLPGLHNVCNALAAVAVGCELGVDFGKIQAALAGFRGIARRFEIKGEAGGVVVVDDYAHHPTEIEATLRAAREVWGRRIVAVFQPHRYTRTAALAEQFGRCFYEADVLMVMPIYPAGEEPVAGVHAGQIVEAASERGHRNVVLCEEQDRLAENLESEVRPGDVVITLGAGDVWKVGEDLLERRRHAS
ncbi:MAG: UDP-N-acetylmuramate--L-alanine ligase [Candidatus Eisenbacteria sp.]|nr:UDP-N-acetylmuramate--L-alanine ligase [Candidatus Eisenbacteria bacterium]